VIDLLNGVVVHAKKGQRQHYQAIQSQLTSSSQPLDIVAALLNYYPFTQLYIADLNAIQKIDGTYTSHYALIHEIQQAFPDITLWVDAGIRHNSELAVWKNLKVRLVIGSENFKHIEAFLALQLIDMDWILSLDFLPNGYCGPTELLMQTAYWPNEVIVMSLAHVGVNLGPNIPLLTETLKRAHGFNVLAAGGIRDDHDLTHLNSMGVAGALIASALHQQQLTNEMLKTLDASINTSLR
jgi:phosphoribosylformimino-5-aminoimidazole carboxamide ribotide isomerase